MLSGVMGRGLLKILGLLVAVTGLWMAVTLLSGPSRADATGRDYGFSSSMAGNIFSGREIYTTNSKTYVGKIITADAENNKVLIRYPNGTEEWKNWDAVLHFGWCVKI